MEDGTVFDAKIQKIRNVVTDFIDIAFSYFFPQSKASSLLYDGSVGASKFVSSYGLYGFIIFMA